MARIKRSAEEQFRYMTETPVSKLILAFSVPSIFTTLITSIYNLSDTFFVGRIGTSATAAVGVVFSINMVLMALGFWVGTGGSTLVSNLMGAQEKERAQRINSTAFWLSMASGILIACVVWIGGQSLMRFLGATDTIVPYAISYASILMIGAPFNSSSAMLGQCLRAEGFSKESMYGNVTGAVLNMILDPIFIFALGLGIKGAAIATVISQMVAWVLQVRYYLNGTTKLKLSIRFVSRYTEDYAQILKYGFPSLCRHGCNMIANVILNSVAGNWGDAAIAAMSICSRLMFVSSAITIGMNNGCQPVIGYAYGSKKYQRVKDAFAYTIRISISCMCGFAIVGAVFAPYLIGFFRDDPEVIRYGTSALRLICLALPFGCMYSTSSVVYQILKKPVLSSVITVGRQLLLYIPMLLILPARFGVIGMQAAGPVADILIGIGSVFMIIDFMKKIEGNNENETK